MIYNDRPACIADDTEAIRRLAPRLLRIRFSTETPEQVKDVLAIVQDSFTGRTGTAGSASYGQKPGFTQGHFRKGIL